MPPRPLPAAVKLAPVLETARVSAYQKFDDGKIWYKVNVIPSTVTGNAKKKRLSFVAAPRPYAVWRRYDHFVDFHTALAAQLKKDPSAAAGRRLPQLPKSRFFVTRAVCEERVTRLDAYTRELLTMPERVTRNLLFGEFFGLWIKDIEPGRDLNDLKTGAKPEDDEDIPLDEPWLKSVEEKRMSRKLEMRSLGRGLNTLLRSTSAEFAAVLGPPTPPKSPEHSRSPSAGSAKPARKSRDSAGSNNTAEMEDYAQAFVAAVLAGEVKSAQEDELRTNTMAKTRQLQQEVKSAGPVLTTLERGQNERNQPLDYSGPPPEIPKRAQSHGWASSSSSPVPPSPTLSNSSATSTEAEAGAASGGDESSALPSPSTAQFRMLRTPSPTSLQSPGLTSPRPIGMKSSERQRTLARAATVQSGPLRHPMAKRTGTVTEGRRDPSPPQGRKNLLVNSSLQRSLTLTRHYSTPSLDRIASPSNEKNPTIPVSPVSPPPSSAGPNLMPSFQDPSVSSAPPPPELHRNLSEPSLQTLQRTATVGVEVKRERSLLKRAKTIGTRLKPAPKPVIPKELEDMSTVPPWNRDLKVLQRQGSVRLGVVTHDDPPSVAPLYRSNTTIAPTRKPEIITRIQKPNQDILSPIPGIPPNKAKRSSLLFRSHSLSTQAELPSHFIQLKALYDPHIILLKISRTVPLPDVLDRLSRKFSMVVGKEVKVVGVTYKDAEDHMITVTDEEDWIICKDMCVGRLCVWAKVDD
ncbi:uncharacterized protein SPPG_05897 [Spizellomyces punctatus DAOM BR117]|uniref:PX domain-containing protein n=1 Tax=Spizellomyces punctatus (strain DAOM BR117) TaxID=645134 RepID=A0A0L0HBG5_SPIPD|nr:uncharacterized protein SPPG_05897 [Spizellomyces punctatus DAOM BR117]KNC98935.1 hypothetical protein SPPG_05897 [Spizellomyces punctatus DAOM BR117]|eukprot:XP_016606975.1 hypothetical protein SPPG_05897 [Spizellomyces punctatus DAOM BR117]